MLVDSARKIVSHLPPQARGILKRAVRKAAAVRKAVGAPGTSPAGSILDSYIRVAPSQQVAVDLFEGEWTSELPLDGVTTGTIRLFEDARITWFVDQMGGDLTGKRVLELGPLEGGHSYMLEQAGASVVAIEGNTRGYLKCLVVKEVLNLQRSQFLLGDFLPYLESTEERFDLLVASGVIYHAPDPIRLLEAIGRTSQRVAIWTHFYDTAVIDANPSSRRLFEDAPVPVQRGGRTMTLHRRRYLEALEWDGFCGGPEDSALWMEKDDLLGVLKDLGFEHIEIERIDLEHSHGPCLTLLASKII